MCQFPEQGVITIQNIKGQTSNMAHDARSITKSHGYDFSMANREAVDVLFLEQHRTESMSAQHVHSFQSYITKGYD